MRTNRSRFVWGVLIASVAIVLAQGCKKKAAAPEAAATDTTTSNTVPDTAATTASAPPAQPPPRRIDFTPIQKMVAAKDYEKATQEFIILQRAIKDPSPDQNMAIVNQMHMLQRTLAGAAASGDPRAKAAIDQLTANISGH